MYKRQEETRLLMEHIVNDDCSCEYYLSFIITNYACVFVCVYLGLQAILVYVFQLLCLYVCVNIFLIHSNFIEAYICHCTYNSFVIHYWK